MGLISLADSLPKGFGLFSLKDKNNWMATLYDGYDNTPFGIAVDNNGIIYIAGSTSDATYSVNLFAAKYDNTGVVQWQKKETTAQVQGRSCSINGTTEIYTSGFYGTGSGLDLATVKINDSGTLQWQRRLGTSGDSFNFSNDTCTDASGNIINVAAITNDTVYESKGFIVKYNSSGTLQWQRNIANGIDTYYYRAVSDSSDNIYAVGAFTPNIDYTNYKALLVKYNSSGTIQWQRELGNSAADSGFNGVVTDSGGDVYCIGYSNHNRSYYSPRIVKYNSSGTLQWQREIYSSTIDVFTKNLAIDSSDNIYGLLVPVVSLANNQIGIVKYNSSGTIQWQRELTTSVQFEGYDIQVVGSNIYITAALTVSNGDNDIVVFKVPTDGSKTGTYTLNGYTYTYSASTFSETASSLTSATSTLTGSTTTHTDQSLSMTLSTTSLTDAIVRF